MRKKLKSRFITIFTALVISFTALFGLLSAGKTVLAAEDETDYLSDLHISTEIGEDGLVKGSTFKLKLDFTTTHTDTFWGSLLVCIGPLNEAGDNFDSDIAKKFEVAKEGKKLKVDYGALPVSAYTVSSDDFFGFGTTYKKYGCCQLAFAYKYLDDEPLSSEIPVSITVDINVLDDIDADSVTFGLNKKTNKAGAGGASVNSPLYNELVFEGYTKERFVPSSAAAVQWPVVSSNEALIQLKYLIKLEAGLSADALYEIDLKNSPQIVLDKSVTQLYVKPIFANESMYAVIGPKLHDGEGVSHNQVKSVNISSSATKLFITSHDGTTADGTQEDEVEIIFTSTRLKDLVATAGTEDMTCGLQGVFDEDIFSYRVNVPDNDLSAKITATVPADGKVAEEISLSADGCKIENETVTSGTEFTVTEISEGAKLILTVTSTEYENLSASYVITFHIASTDTSIKSFTLIRGENVYNSDKLKAEEALCNYHFTIAEADGCSAAITLANGATYKIGDRTGGLYPAGEYTLTVTSEAGTVEEYKIIIVSEENNSDFPIYSILKVVDFVAVESVAVNTVSCFSFPLRVINIVIWDVIVPIFG
ncbi:MAG: hypothetical protein K2K80_03685 [Clostridia bacterium]|nr:hypothetical protein [Clostridia bacterium]